MRDEIPKITALLRYYFKEDPTKLSNEQFATRWQELKYCLKVENKRNTIL